MEYSQTVKHLVRWDPVVKANRKVMVGERWCSVNVSDILGTNDLPALLMLVLDHIL